MIMADLAKVFVKPCNHFTCYSVIISKEHKVCKTRLIHPAMSIQKYFTVVIAALLLNAPGTSRAKDITGASISYQYLGPNQYLIRFKYHHDCMGLPAAASLSLCYQSVSAGLAGILTMNQVPGTGSELPPHPCFLPGLTSCQGGTVNGFDEWVYEGTLSLPQAAPDWVISYSNCCRSAQISTLQPNGIYVYAKLDNLNYPVNNSPEVMAATYAQFCVNTLSDYQLPVYESDGDSLVYSLAPAEDYQSTCPAAFYPAIYNPGYSATHPVSSATPVLFDSSTGTMTFTPDLSQAGVICMLVKEYRNGNLIGEIKTDEMILVINGTLNPNWMIGKVFYDLNGNNIFDAGEQGKKGVIIEVQPAGTYANSDSSGDYAIPLASGTYSATLPALPGFYSAIPSVNTAAFPGTFQTDSMNDFALTSIPWQDLSVSLTGNNVIPGTFTGLHLTYTNSGSIIMNGSVYLVHDNGLIYISSSMPPDTISGDSLTWTFANLNPQDMVDITVNFSAPSNAVPGTLFSSHAEILPVSGDAVPADNYDGIDQLVVGSFDPNEKKVKPDGPVTTSQVSNGDDLEYAIFFQNTGTAPVVNIIISDTLDSNFNIPSFEPVSSSHEYTWNIIGTGIIAFTFSNIMLPDSGTDFLLSQGFIRYRIKPLNNLVAGDKLVNTAYIFFDNNPPVQTNSTSTTVISPASTASVYSGMQDIVVYPNPANTHLQIEMNSKNGEAMEILLSDVTGSILKKLTRWVNPGTSQIHLNISDIANGIYFLNLRTTRGTSVFKVVRQ